MKKNPIKKNPIKKKILLIISGSVSAYKSVYLIRILKQKNYDVTCVLTKGGAKFITALTLASISENNAYQDLFSLKDETEMGHINLSRTADLIVIAPASANIIAKIANGICDDLASTLLMASNKEIFIAPAMNVMMWENKFLQQNIAKLQENNIKIIGPEAGDLACGEVGKGRMTEPEDIVKEIDDYFQS